MNHSKESDYKEIPRKDISVGVGGWAYLPILTGDKLEMCSKLYDHVEVNSTFYKLPSLKQVKGWRSRVPEKFEFTVKASRGLTHVNHLEPKEENFELFAKIVSICNQLKASVLNFQFPPSLNVTPALIKNWEEFLDSAPIPKGVHLAFEIRNARNASSGHLRSFVAEHDIIPTADASRETLGMSSDSKIAYSRIFGFGEHTRWSFDTEELQSLRQRVENVPARKKYLTFHNFTMYEDASRMRSIMAKGRETFEKPDRLEEAWKKALISTQMNFPVSKEKLIQEIGWKTYNSAPDKRVHFSKALETLPADLNFASLDDVLQAFGIFSG